ncbi:MAG: ECF transporter S component [Eubacteriales bacterium]
MLKSSQRTYQIAIAALMLALCFVLPNFTGNIPYIGSMLLPMHLPVLLCGFICGPFWGGAVGFIAPVLRSVLMTMPPMNVAIPMALELATYGAVSGLLYRILHGKSKKDLVAIYVSLISARVVGRVVYGITQLYLTMNTADVYTFSAFVAGSITNSIPGIIAQLTIVPAVVLAINGQNLRKVQYSLD